MSVLYCCHTTAVTQLRTPDRFFCFQAMIRYIIDGWKQNIPVDLRAWLGNNKAKFPRTAGLFEEGKELDVATCLLALAEDAKSR